MYETDQHKIDKSDYSTDKLQAYTIYKQALDTYRDTKVEAAEKNSKDLEVLNIQLEKVAKEINQNIQDRTAKTEEDEREQVLKKLKEEIKGIAYDINRVDKYIEKEDRFIN